MPSPPGEERAVADRSPPSCAASGWRSTRTTPARDRLERRQPLLRLAPTAAGNAALPLRAPGHRPAAGRSSRSSRTASSATRPARSSARTTSRRSRRWSRPRAGSSGSGRPHAGVELLFTPKEEVGLRGAEAFDCHPPRGARRVRLRPGRADRRGDPGRAPRADHARSRSAARPRTRGWRRRKAAPRSRRPRRRSPTCGSGVSTRRPRPTSA